MRLTSAKNKQKANQSETVTNTHAYTLSQIVETHRHTRNPSPNQSRKVTERKREYEEWVTEVKSQTKPLRN